MKRTPLVALAALILGVLIAQIAIASGSGDNASLQRQINQLKAEVASAKAAKKSKRGPPGPAGAQGLQGPPGAPGQDFVTQGTEAWHEIAASSQQTCGPNDQFCGAPMCGYWQNYGGGFSTAAYLRDRLGLVHLKGLVQVVGPCAGIAIFVLPLGYRPALAEVFPALSNDASARVDVGDNSGFGTGAVNVHGGSPDIWLSLDGISFRCEPSGVNGCP